MSVTDPIRPTRHYRLFAPLTAAGCILAIAGCGSSGQKSSGSPRARTQLAFSECMRGHGVTSFPDPGSGGGINIAGTGVNPSSPAFTAAQATCLKLLPGGGPASRPATEQQKRSLFAISVCMRAHGVTGFPDPATTRPANLQDYSAAEGLASNLFLLVPTTINVNTPIFEHAAKTCNFG